MQFLMLTTATPAWMESGQATPEVQDPAWEHFARDVRPGLRIPIAARFDPDGVVSVQVRDGRKELSEEVFPKDEVVFGGYFLVDAQDRDEAVAIAARTPGALTGGWVTVVPVVAGDVVT